MSLRFFRNIILLVLVAAGAYYVLDQYHLLPQKGKEEDVPVFNPDETPSEAVANDEEDTSAEQVLRVLLPGEEIPRQIASISVGSTMELSVGSAAVYRPTSVEPAQAAERWELSAEAEHIAISQRAEGLYAVTLIAPNDAGNTTLAILRVEGTTLRSIEDEHGESTALMLPLTLKEQVLIMPGVNRSLPLSTEGLPVTNLPEELPKTARVTANMLVSTEYELRFVSPEKTTPLTDALHGKASFSLTDALQLPALTTKNNLILVRRPGGTALPGLDLQLPSTGRASGLLTLFSPQLTREWDFRDEVLAHVMRIANAPHGASGKPNNVRRKYSIAHVYYLLSHIPTTFSMKEKNKLAERYFELFFDPEFRSFCERRMNYLPIPDPASISKNGNKIVIEDGALRQLFRFDVKSLQLSVNDVLSQAVQEAYTKCRTRFCASPIPPLAVRLTKVQVSPTSAEDQISWTFMLETL